MGHVGEIIFENVISQPMKKQYGELHGRARFIMGQPVIERVHLHAELIVQFLVAWQARIADVFHIGFLQGEVPIHVTKQELHDFHGLRMGMACLKGLLKPLDHFHQILVLSIYGRNAGCEAWIPLDGGHAYSR